MRCFEKNSENAYSPKNCQIDKINGTIRKCSSRAFQWMVMSVRFDNLDLFGQFLCAALVTEAVVLVTEAAALMTEAAISS
jgi:hypothetical protein